MSKASLERAFYTFAAERNGLALPQLAARVTLVEVPSLAQNDRCFRYLTRVDWAFVSGEACFRGASGGRLGRFAFDDPVPGERTLAARNVDEIVAKLDAVPCGSVGASVDYRVRRDGGRLLASKSFEIGEPGYCTFSLLTGQVSMFNDWPHDAAQGEAGSKP